MKNRETSKLISDICRADRVLLNPSTDPIRYDVDSEVAIVNKRNAIESLMLPSPSKKGVGNEFMQDDGLLSMGGK